MHFHRNDMLGLEGMVKLKNPDEVIVVSSNNANSIAIAAATSNSLVNNSESQAELNASTVSNADSEKRWVVSWCFSAVPMQMTFNCINCVYSIPMADLAQRRIAACPTYPWRRATTMARNCMKRLPTSSWPMRTIKVVRIHLPFANVY